MEVGWDASSGASRSSSGVCGQAVILIATGHMQTLSDGSSIAIWNGTDLA